MTLPASGQLDMNSINVEFGRGLNLNAYRGTPWYTDAGGSGTFSAGQISMAEFYGKRATMLRGITEFNYMGYGGTGANMSLGADNVNRYIVVVAMHQQTTNASATLAGCTVGGVNLPLVIDNIAWNSAQSELIRVAIFGGYISTGASGVIDTTLSNGSSIGGYRAVYRLVGTGITTYGTAAAADGTFSVPASSVILSGAGHPDNSGAISWTNLTAALQLDAGGYQFGTGYYYAPNAETRYVTRNKGPTVFAAFG